MKQNIYSSQAQKLLCFHFKKDICLRDKSTITNQARRACPQHFLADYLNILGADNVLQVLANIFKILGSLRTPNVTFAKPNLTI